MIAAAYIFLSLAQGPTPQMDVVYSHVAGEELKMDIYRPAASSPDNSKLGANGALSTKLPAVVVIHGGAWVMGDKKDIADLASRLAAQGVVVANINYRLAPKHKWPAMLDDVQTAVRFLRANADRYGIDAKRIGAAGASAGGHLSVFLGVTDTRDPKPTEYAGFSSKVKTVLDIFGPTDLTDKTDFPPGPLTNLIALQVFGKKPEEAGEAAKSASPLLLLTKDDAPMFIFQGLSDPLVKPHQSRVLEARLKELGIPCDSAYVEGMGHEMPLEKPQVKAAAERALKWFLDYLKK